MYRAIAGRMRRVTGWRRPTVPSPHPHYTAIDPGAVVSIPDDLRPTVQDQGSIGDCTCQALRELMTGLWLRDQARRGAAREEVIYSALAPYWWARQVDGGAPTDDAGSTVATVFQVAAASGLPHVEAWPDSMPFQMQPDVAAETDAAKHKILLPFFLPNVATIKASLASGFAVEIGFDCPRQLFTADVQASGNVPYSTDPSDYDGSGHAVSVWAADDGYSIGASKGALKANFHWSRNAGDGGYFYLPYDYLTSGRGGDAHTVRLAGAP